MPEENQHARDSAELRRLCSERDQLRSELAAAKETIMRYETTAENCDLLRAELAAIKGQASGDCAYLLANKVREDMDRIACPDAWMVVAYAAIVDHYDCIREVARLNPAPANSDSVPVPVEFVRFLLGEADKDGVGFGEIKRTELGRFWWRKELRAMLAANPAAKGAKP